MLCKFCNLIMYLLIDVSPDNRTPFITWIYNVSADLLVVSSDTTSIDIFYVRLVLMSIFLHSLDKSQR